MVINGPRNAVKTEAENSDIFVQIVLSISKDKNIKRFPNLAKYGINTFGNGRHYLLYQNDISKRCLRHTHRRLRSARRSLMTNLPYLFTYQDYPELEIPNTTNYAESVHSRIKELLRVHRGFNSALKQKIIKEILSK